MKALLESIINRKNISRTVIVAKDLDHLDEIIKAEMKEKGENCSLNFIDVSKLEAMPWLFSYHKTFNGDISEWDVSNCIDMAYMFFSSAFTGDISMWEINPNCVLRGTFKDCLIPKEHMPVLPRKPILH